MSRRRNLSTDISIDKKVKRVSDFAALLYTWMIPHADDFCRLVAKDADEINLLVVPNRRKTDDEVAAALDELFDAELIGQDETGHYFLPSCSFYKYQSKIPEERRVVTPKPGRSQLALPWPIRAQKGAKGRERAQKGASSSSSLTLSLKEYAAAKAAPVDNSVIGKEELFNRAQIIAADDSERMKQLAQFINKTIREGKDSGDSDVIIRGAILGTLDALSAKAIKEGQSLEQARLWSFLQETYKWRRTRAFEIQCQNYKAEPLGKFGDILDKISRSQVA